MISDNTGDTGSLTPKFCHITDTSTQEVLINCCHPTLTEPYFLASNITAIDLPSRCLLLVIMRSLGSLNLRSCSSMRLKLEVFSLTLILNIIDLEEVVPFSLNIMLEFLSGSRKMACPIQMLLQKHLTLYMYTVLAYY